MVENRLKIPQPYEENPVIHERKAMKIGIDIGSTTIKCVVLDDEGKLIHKSYERHFAMITEKAREVIKGLIEKFNIKRTILGLPRWH